MVVSRGQLALGLLIALSGSASAQEAVAPTLAPSASVTAALPVTAVAPVAVGPTVLAPNVLAPNIPAPTLPEPTVRGRLVIVAGGDVSFGREAGRALLDDPTYQPLRGLEPLWAGADVRFVNLESQLTDLGGETQSPYDRLVFAGPPAAAASLSAAGVHVVSTANNHAWDYGKSALLETLLHLDRAGIRHSGTGATLEEAERPALLEVNGWKIALFAVTRIWNQGEFQRHPGRANVAWADHRRLAARMAAAREQNDLVFVSLHTGAEYVNAPAEATVELTQQLMRAGADAIFGHHPHVIQGVAWSGERPVFYSLGNLVFGSRRGYPWTRYGMLARLEFQADGARAVSICPFRIEIGSHEPRVLDGRYGGYDRARFRRHFELVNGIVGKTAVSAADDYGCTQIAPASALPRPSPAVPPLNLAATARTED